MKVCPQCHASYDDEMSFCAKCGTALEPAEAAEVFEEEIPAAEEIPAMPEAEPAPQPEQPVYQPPFVQQPAYQQPAYQQPQQFMPPVQPVIPAYDHTAEFTAEDIAENKLLAVLPYLFGLLGLAVTYLAKRDSAFLAFHQKQALKMMIIEWLLAIAVAATSWLILPLFVGGIAITVLAVLYIIAVFQVLGNKAKEPTFIRDLKFLK